MVGQKKIPECIIQGKLNCRGIKEALGLLIIAMVTFFFLPMLAKVNQGYIN
jgi:hypothetical protein